jgi:eukaryotic-like serine/threonine-protein kinase
MFPFHRRLNSATPIPPKSDGGYAVNPRDENEANRAPHLVDELRRQSQLSQSQKKTTSSLPIIAEYDLLGVLGEGGMGIVYKARHFRLKRLVALKMIAAEHVVPSARRRFQTEAETIARLHHPNIVQIFDIGEHQGRPFLALELVEGGSLANLLASGPLPVPLAVNLAEQLARAMHYAHQKGVIHRDLKPANILLQTGNGGAAAQNDSVMLQVRNPNTEIRIPKITDFGLAKFLDEDQNRTRNGMILGTPAYMAPEQALGNSQTIGPPADVYALGTILYEMLTGKPPFSGKNSWEVLSRVVREHPAPPSQLRLRLARDLDTICLKALAKDPHRRYASAGDLAADLERFATGEEIEARPERHWERLGRRVRQYPFTFAAIALFFGAMVLAGSYFQQQRSEVKRALQQGRQLRRDGSFDAGLIRLKEGQERLGSLPFMGDLRQQLDAEIKTATRDAVAGDLHAIAEQMRYRYDPQTMPSHQVQHLVEQCRQIWEARTLLVQFDGGTDAAWTEGVVRDLYDVALLGSRLEQHLKLAARGRPIGDDGPIRLLQELERRRVPEATLAPLRQYNAERLGQDGQTPLSGLRHSAWDYYVRGRLLRDRQQLSEAAEQFSRAIELDPRIAVFHVESGRCALQQRCYLEARDCFTTCIAIIRVEQSDRATGRQYSGKNTALAACYCSRALAEMGLRRWPQAETDLSQALAIEPDLGDAWLNRGILNRQRGQIGAALADLQHALELKVDPAKVHYQLALCFREAGEWERVRLEVQKARQYADCPSEIANLEQELQKRQHE